MKNKSTWEKYTANCLETWDGTAKEDRALLGFVGEIGELTEFYRKTFDVKITEWEIEELIGEFGDFMFYYAVLVYHIGGNHLSDLQSCIAFVKKQNCECNIFDDKMLFEVCTLCEIYKKRKRGDNNYRHDFDFAEKVLPIINNCLNRVLCMMSKLNIDLQEVLDKNTQKLASRKKRNVLFGSGNKR